MPEYFFDKHVLDASGRTEDNRLGSLYQKIETVFFNGGMEINPNIELEALHIFRGLDREKNTLKLKVTGNLSKPEISFALNEVDIEETDAISYLLFGQSSDELSHSQKSQMAGQDGATSRVALKRLFTGQLMGQISGVMRKKLNLDVIEFKGDKDWRKASVVIGKYLTNDLYFSYQREFNLGRSHEVVPEQVFLEYEINRFLFLQAIKGDDKSTGFDIIWKFEQ